MQILEIASTTPAEAVEKACQVLRQGGLLIFPTETTYGAGVDATNPQAVAKLLAYKSRREGKPLSIAVTDMAMAAKYVEINEAARSIYERFLPGPVTVVSKGLGVTAPGVESEFGTLGVRIPDYPLIQDLVKAYGKPITATSANGSGAKRPYTIADILAGISETQKSLIDLVLDAGELPHRPPSTVIDTTLSTPVTFRQGELTVAPATSGAGYRLDSQSEAETKSIAGRLLLKHWNEIKETGLVIGLDGSLGVGKTIFAKGAAEFLQIDETISSPTYTYIEEYQFIRHGVSGQMYHLDLWKVGTQEELIRLQIDQLLRPNNLILIEWFSQVEPWIQPIILNAGTPLLTVEIAENKGDLSSARTLTIHD